MSGISNDYTWVTAGGGDWSDPANWADITTGQTPAVTAPGSLDVATVGGSGIEIMGTGAADSLAFQGTGTILADLNIGTLAVTDQVTIQGVVTANTIDSGASVLVDYGKLSVQAANITFGSLTLELADGQASLMIGTLQTDGWLNVGLVGTNAADNLVITAGDTLTAFNLGIKVDYISAEPSSGSLLVDGLLRVLDGTVNGEYFYDFVSDFPYVIASNDLYLQGTGTVEVLSGGSLNLMANVANTGPTFQLDGGAGLYVQGYIASNTTINLLGNNNTIDFVSPLQDGSKTLVPGTGVLATIEGFNSSDTIIFNNMGSISITNGTLGDVVASSGQGTITLDGGFTANDVQAMTTMAVTETFSFPPYFAVVQPLIIGLSVSEQAAPPVACFAAGTRLATPDGPRPVEAMVAGDLVLTISGPVRPIRWIGRRTVDCRHHPCPERVWPVRVAAHAFGEGRPCRPLYLSPDHSVFVDGLLIPVKFLINDTTIVQAKQDQVTYYHIELDSHDVVLAEGLPCETYLEIGGRSAFENTGPLQLHPEFGPDDATVAEIWEAWGYAPMVRSGEHLRHMQVLLEAQAAMLGDGLDRNGMIATEGAAA